MTSGTIPVRVEWALEGKQPDGEDYRILASSTGELNSANFADALSRFQLGELTTLPQVSVSYARLADQPGVGYLALAIDDAVYDGLREHFSEDQLVELGLHCAIALGVGRLSATWDVSDDLPDSAGLSERLAPWNSASVVASG